jgi:uncharacterized protein YkwD
MRTTRVLIKLHFSLWVLTVVSVALFCLPPATLADSTLVWVVPANPGSTVSSSLSGVNGVAARWEACPAPSEASRQLTAQIALRNATSSAELAAQVIYLTNQERVSRGLLPLKANANLTTTSSGHSQDMALNDFFGHTSSNGDTLATRYINAGYVNYVAGGENIAAGFDTAESVMTGWMSSTGHLNNILNSSYREIGVGYYFQPDDQPNVRLPDGTLGGPYFYYWTQDFGARSNVYPVIINLEAPTTNTPAVTLAIHGQGWAAQMQVSNSADFAGTSWEPYASTKAWTLLPGNGIRTVYIKLRNSYGLEVLASDEIQLTGQPEQPTPTPTPTPQPTPTPTPTPGSNLPAPSVSINDGQPYTRGADVTLSLELPADARKVEAADNPGFTNAHSLPLQPQVAWHLDENKPGRQVVYVRYQDAAGRLSQTGSASIVYDPLPPTGRVTITANNGLSVLISVEARDSLSGVAAMVVGLSPDELTDWQPYLTVVKLPLPPGGQGGVPVAYARFRDQAGNESPIYRSDQPISDTQTFIPFASR